MRRMLVIANASAGTADHAATAAVRAVLQDVAEVALEHPDGPAALSRVLDRRDGREVVVLGGDGSLHVAVACLYERGELPDTEIGLVPLGTGNDFARTVGLPLEPDAAARVIVDGELRRFDLLVDDAGGVVVNAVHLGVGAEAGREAHDLKARLGKVAYPVAAAIAGVRAKGWRVGVAVDGRVVNERHARVLMVGIGNGQTVGGGTPLAPAARPDDGLVDVVVSRAIGPLARVAYGAQLALGRHVDRDDVRTVRGREVRVAGDGVPVNADGEIGDPVSRRAWRVEPGAWQLRVPAGT